MNVYRKGRTRWPLLLALLIVHGLVLIGLAWQHLPHTPQPAAMQLVNVAEPLRPPPRELRLPAPSPSAWSPAPMVVPTPEVTITATAAVSAIAAATPASAASSPQQRLNLALPNQMRTPSAAPTAREQALNDPRANTAKPTVEYRVADATGTLPITVQSTTDGLDSTMVRQGSKCTKINKARIATIDPIDERFRSAVASAGACFNK